MKIFIVCACPTDPKGRKLTDHGVNAAQRARVAINEGSSTNPKNVTLMSAATGAPTLTARFLAAALSVEAHFERWLNADTPGGQQLTHWQQLLAGVQKRGGQQTVILIAEADTVGMMLSAMAGVEVQVAVQPGAVFSYDVQRTVLQQDLPIVYRIHSGSREPARAEAR